MGNPPDAALPCYTSPKLSETTNTLDGETGSFDLAGNGMKAISDGGTNSVVKTTYTGSEDPPSAAPSCYTCSKFGETANVKANTFHGDTGNFELTGSGLESISCSGNEDPPSAAPSDYTGPKLRETVNVTVNTFASETGSFELTGSGLESETVNLKVNTLAGETSSFELTGSGLESISWSGNEDPLSAASSDYMKKISETVNLTVNTFASETDSFDLTGRGLESETVNLKVNTFANLGKSFTNVAPMISPADAQAAEKLYQLAEIIGVSRTLPNTLGTLGPRGGCCFLRCQCHVRRFTVHIDSGG